MARPFLPVFGLGALTFFVCMFASIHMHDWGQRLVLKPKWKWRGHAVKAGAFFVILLGSFSFAFGWPWAAFF